MIVQSNSSFARGAISGEIAATSEISPPIPLVVAATNSPVPVWLVPSGSLPEIGRRFGDRDHTTVLHAVRKIEALVASHQALTAPINSIKVSIPEAARAGSPDGRRFKVDPGTSRTLRFIATCCRRLPLGSCIPCPFQRFTRGRTRGLRLASPGLRWSRLIRACQLLLAGMKAFVKVTRRAGRWLG